MVPFAVLNDVVQEATDPKPVNPDDLANNNLPPCIFLMGKFSFFSVEINHWILFPVGGPGSNKGTLIRDMMYLYPGWASINVGGILRSRVSAWRSGHISPEGLPTDKLELIENILGKGDLVSQVKKGLDEPLICLFYSFDFRTWSWNFWVIESKIWAIKKVSSLWASLATLFKHKPLRKGWGWSDPFFSCIFYVILPFSLVTSPL